MVRFIGAVVGEIALSDSGGGDLDSEALADGAEGLVDLADVGAVVGVGEFADGGFADAEAAGTRVRPW